AAGSRGDCAERRRRRDGHPAPVAAARGCPVPPGVGAVGGRRRPPPQLPRDERVIGMDAREALGAIAAGRALTRAEAESAMGSVMAGEATPAQLAALLAALALR